MVKHTDNRRDDAAGASRRAAAPQRWRCPNRLFLGANRGTSCPVNTCHHRCFSVGAHAKGGAAIYVQRHRFRALRGTRHACILFGVYVFLDTPLDWGKSGSPRFLAGSLTLQLWNTGGLEASVKSRRVPPVSTLRAGEDGLWSLYIPIRENGNECGGPSKK